MIRAAALALWLLAPGAAAAAPLHIAAEQDDHETLAALLAGGAQVDAADAHGDTPLHKAALGNARQAAALLLGKGADVNARNSFGTAPLHYAASQNAVTIAAMLLGKGADVNAANHLGEHPLHWAARSNAAEAADLLLRKGADGGAVSGWFWLYNFSAERESWRRGKAWFDGDMREFIALERKRTKRAKTDSATRNLLTGAAGCAISGGAGCAGAAASAASNWAREIAHIEQWEDALAELDADASVHAARFLLPPNEQSRPVRIDGRMPFTRYVAKLTTKTSACTAFLVRPKIALTNAHCVCRDQRCAHRIPARDMTLTFARGDLSGKHDITAGVRKVHARDWRGGYQHDYAVLVLQRAPKLDGHLEVAPNADGVRTIATAGYPGDLLDGAVMTALWGCRLKARTGILFFADADCHNYKGASGSPYIAVDGPHRGKVVGINAFGVVGHEQAGGGPSADSFYRQLQRIIAAEER